MTIHLPTTTTVVYGEKDSYDEEENVLSGYSVKIDNPIVVYGGSIIFEIYRETIEYACEASIVNSNAVFQKYIVLESGSILFETENIYDNGTYTFDVEIESDYLENIIESVYVYSDGYYACLSATCIVKLLFNETLV